MTETSNCRPQTVSDISAASTKTMALGKNQGTATWNGNDVMPPHDQVGDSICTYDKAGSPCLACPPALSE